LKYSLSPEHIESFGQLKQWRSLNPNTLNNLKARVTECLSWQYIIDVLASKLKKEGIQIILDTDPRLPLSCVVRRLLLNEKVKDWRSEFESSVISLSIIDNNGPEKVIRDDGRWGEITEKEKHFYVERWKEEKIGEAASVPNRIKMIFLRQAIYPDSALLQKVLKLFATMDVATDGILFKVRKTGDLISKKSGLSRLTPDVESMKGLPSRIPIVSGEVEIVEVKANKARIPFWQQKAYAKAIRNGCPLHYFHVEILSLDDNDFNLTEKIITDPCKVKSFPMAGVCQVCR